MQTALLKLTAAATVIASVSAELKQGACPVRDQNKPVTTFDKYKMAGLWYEYVWEGAYALGYDY